MVRIGAEAAALSHLVKQHTNTTTITLKLKAAAQNYRSLEANTSSVAVPVKWSEQNRNKSPPSTVPPTQTTMVYENLNNKK